ncbi:flagellar basal body P-ring protein FlgI [Acidicapsa acidisoli]|uniref:flagellar basal body P-ring protein FlgI n=1 Tax=Acidicapsa acidisoli TaxID=1615681 RepID=UPI00295A62BD|nr:flagellar basal body P-ring protein FlgI [Acidicapsa acidisoli]
MDGWGTGSFTPVQYLVAGICLATAVSVDMGNAQTSGQAFPPSRVTLNSTSTDLMRKTTETAPVAQLTRVKDVASIEGIRDNQLIGYGIVVGLRGTGDTQQTVYPVQTLLSTLERLGITVPQTGTNSASNMQVKNIAGVFAIATLPPFSRTGERLDVTVSSAGDARSLEGGVLLMTPLYGPDGQIYAQAQGPLVLGGYQVTGGANTRQVNHPTTARVPSGALVERIVPFDMKDMHTVSVVLNDADFHTAERMAGAINTVLKTDRAHVADSRRVEITPQPGEDLPALLEQVEAVEIEVFPRARVVVNERTGTVVIGGKVRLQPVSILHGGLSINVIVENQVSQPNAFAQGTTQVVQQTTLQAQDKPVNQIELKAGATVEDLVQELQQIGATARDVISILQGMKEAGALEADLEVL